VTGPVSPQWYINPLGSFPAPGGGGKSVRDIPLEALLVTTALGREEGRFTLEEQRTIAVLCAQRPQSLAEVAARLALTVRATRVLVGDMLSSGLLTMRAPAVAGPPIPELLDRVLRGLRHFAPGEGHPNVSTSVKIVVAGGANAGKKTLIRAASGSAPLAVEVDERGTSRVSVDVGRVVTGEDLVLYLFGMPTRPRYFMWDELARGALGAVVLVDTRRLADAYAPIDFFESRRLPYLVTVNEFDHAPRYADEDVRDALGISRRVPLLARDARDVDSARQLLAGVVEHAKAGPTRPPATVDDEVAVDAYLDTDDRDAATRIVQALDHIADLLGYDGPLDETIRAGSIWRRARAKIKAGVTSDEVRTRLIKLERALELQQIDTHQADVDLKFSEAVAQLTTSLEAVPQACLRVGSLLYVKYTDETGPVLLVRTLSQKEIRTLERFPEIQMKPRHVLEALATAISPLDEVGP
jgi:signal recognition particle receptor subunit beta